MPVGNEFEVDESLERVIGLGSREPNRSSHQFSAEERGTMAVGYKGKEEE